MQSNSSRFIRTLQHFRLFRLVRLFRLQQVLDALLARSYSERLALAVSLVKSVMAIVAVMHGIACGWVGLGRAGGAEGWVASREVEHSRWHQYALSFHWSLTQFYGSMDLQPMNLRERLFAIGALLAGFFIATAFVSVFTSSMTRLHIITSAQSAQLRALSKYLQAHNISRALSVRVRVNAKFAARQQLRNLPESDVELLSLISQPLRVELHYEVHMPVLAQHPLLRWAQERAPAAMRKICHGAMALMAISKDDILFCRGEIPVAPRMLFVLSGSLTYFAHGELDRQEALRKDEWACEQVLWTNWVYHGVLRADEECQIATLGGNELGQQAGHFRAGGADLALYAAEYLTALNATPAAKRSELGSSVDSGSLVARAYGKPRDAQLAMGSKTILNLLPALPSSRRNSKVLPSSGSGGSANFDDLVTVTSPDGLACIISGKSLSQ